MSSLPVLWNCLLTGMSNEELSYRQPTEKNLVGRQTRNFHHWPHFNGAPTDCGDSLGNSNRIIQVFGVDKVIATELLARLCKRSIGDQTLVVSYADACCRRSEVERGRIEVVP